MFVLSLLAPSSKVLRLLFVGNSLLNNHDIGAQVAAMAQTDGAGRLVVEKSYFVGHLEDVAPGTAVEREIVAGRYDIVVLQAAMVSSSMTRRYRQDRAIAMAKASRANGSRVLLFVEWPRRGIDETEFTKNVYREIADRSRAELLPVCDTWNAFAKSTKADLWSPDGNHPAPIGSYVSALAVYFRIFGTARTPSYGLAGVDRDWVRRALETARSMEDHVKPRAGSNRSDLANVRKGQRSAK